MAATKSVLSVGELVGTTYEILGRVGAGAMGVVYKARDRKLERTVALKFLPPGLNASDLDKGRFLKEARIASSLDHPNIGVIHGIEETSDGRTFIVMAFYEGQSLAHRIYEGPTPLSVADVVEIVIQIARGLAEAHSRSIIHRDIKPSNVMLTSQETIKIVDFGLARVNEATATFTHGAAGTLSYVSPEQVAGKTADQRSDIWALGVTMLEALIGENPFQRESMAATFVAILSEAPPPLERVPLEVQQVVYHALSKDPIKRYQSCSEMLRDLEAAKAALANSGMMPELSSLRRSWQAKALRESRHEASRSAWPLPIESTRTRNRTLAAIAAVVLLVVIPLLFPSVRERAGNALLGSHDEKHIAVLPFDNIGNNPQDEPLVEGMVDSLSGRLSNLEVGKQSLWVIPSSEVRRLKVADPTSALRDLGATLVVKGTIAREGQQIRLNMSLIDTKSLRQIGSVDLEDQAGDLATLQDEAVAKLAHLMNITVTADMLRSTGGSVNPAAYENYLTALGYMQRYDKPGNLDLAIQALTDSVKTDPRFALGYAQLGEAYRLKNRLDQNPNWLAEAQANCKKAAELDNRIPAVHVTLARIHDLMGQHDLALQEFQRALDINPRDAAALNGLAHAYEDSGRIPDAEATFQKAAALRPDSWDSYDELGNFYVRQSKFQEAVQQYRRALDLTPDNAQVYLNLGASYLDSGDPKLQADAERALKKSIALSPSYPAYANLGNLYLTGQRYADSASVTENALKLNDHDYMVWNNLVLAYEWLKDKDKAEAARQRMLALLEQTVKLKPQDASAQATLAVLYAHYGLADKAASRIQTALALAPDDSGVRAEVAEAYELLGKRGEAISEMQKAVQKGFALEQAKIDPELTELISDPKFHQQ
jgi:serine/threonine protein kinase/tetratricopeptide (TPR) repeat protein